MFLDTEQSLGQLPNVRMLPKCETDAPAWWGPAQSNCATPTTMMEGVDRTAITPAIGSTTFDGALPSDAGH
jgi:hypothetical protein